MGHTDRDEALLAELLDALARLAPLAETPAFVVPNPTDRRSTVSPPLSPLGSELGERLVSEILEGVRAGRQGVFVSEPERLRTAIFLRGLTLGAFARHAGIAPSTLSRALAGQPISPASWRLVITTLRLL